jgi:7-cyano-7-deazaguanine synthase
MRSLVILSGGLDSTVLCAQESVAGEVRALSVHYGQRHARELLAAERVAARLGIQHESVDLSSLRPLLSGSSQTDDEVAVPFGHYAADSMRQTIVPNRNMILLAVAVARALSTGCARVLYGAHAGDHAIYPDCRPDFLAALAAAVRVCDWRPVELEAPFIGLTKAQIVARGAELRAPLELTWSCYVGGERHCGRCGACVERREAFHAAAVSDPTAYEAV